MQTFDIVKIGDATYIYSLIDPRDGSHRYVGKTVRPLRARLVSHKQAAMRGNLPVNRWARKVAHIKFGPEINWLETVEVGDDWAAREKFWIAEFRNRGERLLNLTDGGEGLPGLLFTESHKQKIAASLRRGCFISCTNCKKQAWKRPSALKENGVGFCSRQCANKFNKGGHDRI